MISWQLTCEYHTQKGQMTQWRNCIFFLLLEIVEQVMPGTLIKIIGIQVYLNLEWSVDTAKFSRAFYQGE